MSKKRREKLVKIFAILAALAMLVGSAASSLALLLPNN